MSLFGIPRDLYFSTSVAVLLETGAEVPRAIHRSHLNVIACDKKTATSRGTHLVVTLPSCKLSTAGSNGRPCCDVPTAHWRLIHDLLALSFCPGNGFSKLADK